MSPSLHPHPHLKIILDFRASFLKPSFSPEQHDFSRALRAKDRAMTQHGRHVTERERKVINSILPSLGFVLCLFILCTKETGCAGRRAGTWMVTPSFSFLPFLVEFYLQMLGERGWSTLNFPDHIEATR